MSYAIVTFTSPSGFRASSFLVRTGAAPRRARWKGKVNIPRCSESGTWTASVVLSDIAGNQGTYSAAQLKAKRFSTNLAVKALDIQGPAATVPATVPHTGPLVVTFSEPTLWKEPQRPAR